MDERTTDRPADGGVSGAADTWPLSAREAAANLGVSERTVRRAIASGDLPATLHAGVCSAGTRLADGTACGGEPGEYKDRCGTCKAGACQAFPDGTNCDRPGDLLTCKFSTCTGGICFPSDPRPDFSLDCDYLGGDVCVGGDCLFCPEGPAGGADACFALCHGTNTFCRVGETCCGGAPPFGTCCPAGTVCDLSTSAFARCR